VGHGEILEAIALYLAPHQLGAAAAAAMLIGQEQVAVPAAAAADMVDQAAVREQQVKVTVAVMQVYPQKVAHPEAAVEVLGQRVATDIHKIKIMLLAGKGALALLLP
jgi:hypothetical protein